MATAHGRFAPFPMCLGIIAPYRTKANRALLQRLLGDDITDHNWPWRHRQRPVRTTSSAGFNSEREDAPISQLRGAPNRTLTAPMSEAPLAKSRGSSIQGAIGPRQRRLAVVPWASRPRATTAIEDHESRRNESNIGKK